MEILPKKWQKTALINILSARKGKKPQVLIEQNINGYLPYILIEQLEGKPYRLYAKDEKIVKIDESEVIIVWDGSIGKCGSGFYGALGSTFVAMKPLAGIPTKFLEYIILEKQNYIKETSTGVGLQHINKNFFKECLINLPPLAEQERIVTKLDTLFAQLETIKEALERIPKLLKDFRQQVLTQAVTGKLTEKWRLSKELEEWQVLQLIDVIVDKPKNGYSPKAVDYETSLKSLTLSATTSGKFNPSFVKYIDEEKPSKESHLWLKYGDILIQRSNSLEYVGTAAIYDGEEYDFIYPDIMMKIKANKKILNQYLFYSLSSISTKEYFKRNASGTAGNMPKINQEIVSKAPINLPPFIEQQEIVSRVESLFAKLDKIEGKYKSLKDKSAILPQTILHKAFKGELVEQLPTDGDAKDLLEEIKKLK